jgi:hypothetical protein
MNLLTTKKKLQGSQHSILTKTNLLKLWVSETKKKHREQEASVHSKRWKHKSPLRESRNIIAF